MSLYTDTEVQAFDEWLGIGPNAAKNVLDKIAPTIAARALRGHADELIAAVAQFPETSWERHNNEATADLARRRADEIEAGQP